MPPPRPDAQSFDHFPRVYERYAQLNGGPLLADLAERLPAHGGRAADLGCGSGRHTTLLADRYDEVLAVDLSEPMLDLARAQRARPNISYQRRDLTTVAPEHDGTFDLVFSAYTLHHLPDLNRTLRQLYDLLNPGGQAILVDIVDKRRQVPRSWFYWDAMRTFVQEVGRRPVRDAVANLQVKLTREWLDHVTTDRVLPPAEFAERYGRVFPDSTITPMGRARVFHSPGKPPY